MNSAGGALANAFKRFLSCFDPNVVFTALVRLMALAIRFERLIRDGAVTDYAELARLGHVTRARVTQIMNLLLLAPDLQEAILFLPRVERGEDPIELRELQPVASQAEWPKQRVRWRSFGDR